MGVSLIHYPYKPRRYITDNLFEFVTPEQNIYNCRHINIYSSIEQQQYKLYPALSIPIGKTTSGIHPGSEVFFEYRPNQIGGGFTFSRIYTE